jgi:hypothetical protein
MSTLRFMQYIEAATKIGAVIGQVMPDGQSPTPAVLHFFRLLVPLVVSEPIRPGHLKRVSAVQILAVFEAWQEVNDLPYMVRSLRPSGDGKGQGLDRFIVNLAKAMHVRVHEVLETSYQEVIATVEGLNAERLDLPAGAEPLDEDERHRLRNLASQAGFEVN